MQSRPIHLHIHIQDLSLTSSSHLYTPLPLPLVDPLAIPLPPPLPPLAVPPRVGIPPLPRAVGMPLPLPAPRGVFGAGAGLAMFLNLLAALELGGLSTKDVSVVRKVASTSSTPDARRLGKLAEGLREGWFCGRLNESGTGACNMVSVTTHACLRSFQHRHCAFSRRERILRTSGKSTQKAFMFMPYRKPAKLSLNRARLSCMSCSCTKFCSRSAMASLSSANPSDRPSSALEDDAPRERWALSRRELREEGRRGVVGRERGERERRRRSREEGGSWVGVVDAILLCCLCCRCGGAEWGSNGSSQTEQLLSCVDATLEVVA